MMNEQSMQNQWSKYLRFFTEQNSGRLTRLGVFERDGDNVTDYWLESGLAFLGIDIDHSSSKVTIQILLGNLEHSVVEPRHIKFVLGRSGDEDGIDITDAEGRTTVLRFEIDRN